MKSVNNKSSAMRNDLVVLFETYDLNIHDLIKILTVNHDLNVWPKPVEANSFSNYASNMKTFEKNYLEQVQEEISRTRVILAVIKSKRFEINEKNVKKYVDYSHSIGKSVIAIIMSENELCIRKLRKPPHAQQTIESLNLEMNKADRGAMYRPYIWMNNMFDEIIGVIESALNKPLKEKEYHEEKQVYLDYSISKNSPNIMPLLSLLNEINLSQHHLRRYYNRFHEYKFCFHRKKKLYREYMYDYMLLDKFISLNMACQRNYTRLMRFVDGLILESVKSIEPASDTTSNIVIEKLNDFIKFRLNRFNIDSNATMLNQISTHIQKNLKKPSEKVLEGLSTIMKLLQDDAFKTMFDYLPYTELRKSKYIICETKLFEKISDDTFSAFQKSFFIFNLESKANPFNNISLYSVSMKNQNLKCYDLSKHLHDLLKGHVTRCLISDVCSALSVQSKDAEFINEYNLFISYNTNEDALNLVTLQSLINLLQKAQLNVLTGNENNSDLIEKSRFVIFVLTNDYLKSEKYYQDYKYSKIFKKRRFFIILETLEPDKYGRNFDKFNAIDMSKGDTLAQLHKLFHFIRSVYAISVLNCQFDRKVACITRSQIERVSVGPNIHPEVWKYHQEVQMEFYGNSPPVKIQQDKYMILLFNNQDLFFQDVNSFKTIKLLKLPQDRKRKVFTSGCIINHLNFLCLTGKYEAKDEIFFLLLMNTNDGKVVKEMKIAGIAYCVYNEFNQVMYMAEINKGKSALRAYNHELKLLKTVDVKTSSHLTNNLKSIKLVNNLIYILYSYEVIIYSLNLDYVSNFYTRGNCPFEIFVNYYSNNIFICNDSSIHVYDLMSHQYLYEVRDYYLTPSRLHRMYPIYLRKNICFRSDYNQHARNLYKFAYKLDFNSKNSLFLNQFVCKFNKYDNHSIQDAYILPCHNFACLKCICENYCFKMDVLKCNFCEGEHRYDIVNGLRRYTLLNEIFNQNAKEIAIEQIKYTRHLMSYAGCKCENAKHAHCEIEVHLESLDKHIENRLQIQFSNLESLNKLIKSKNIKVKSKEFTKKDLRSLENLLKTSVIKSKNIETDGIKEEICIGRIKDVPTEQKFKYQPHYDAIKLHVFIVHPNDNTKKYVELKRILIDKCNLKVIIKEDINESVKKNIEAIRCIEISTIIIFCLTCQYINSIEFKLELKQAQESNKIIIFALIDDIDLNENPFLKNSKAKFHAFKFKDSWSGDEYYRLIKMIYSTFGRQNFISLDGNNKDILLRKINWDDYSIEIDGTLLNESTLVVKEIKKILNDVECEGCTKILTNGSQLNVIKACENSFKVDVYDENMKKINEFEFMRSNQVINGGCYIKQLKKICLVTSENKRILFLNDDFVPINKLNLCEYNASMPKIGCFKDVDYNDSNNLIYLISDYSLHVINASDFKKVAEYFFCDHSAIKIKLVKNLIYILDSNLIYIYEHQQTDNTIKLITKFGYSIINNACDFTYYIESTENQVEFLFILESNEPYLKLFNLSNHEYSGSIKFEEGIYNPICNHSIVYFNRCIYVKGKELTQITIGHEISVRI